VLVPRRSFSRGRRSPCRRIPRSSLLFARRHAVPAFFYTPTLSGTGNSEALVCSRPPNPLQNGCLLCLADSFPGPFTRICNRREQFLPPVIFLRCVRPGVRLASGPWALNDGEVCQETQALHCTALNPANPHALGRCRYGPRQPLLGYTHGRSGIRSHAVTDQTSIMRFVEDNWLGGG
jgi:hypothetical protein